MLRLWISALFLTVAIWKSAEGCSCTADHPQNDYCTSVFVILATPKYRGELFDGVNAFYILDIKKILKASDDATAALGKNLVYTPIASDNCPVTLEINKEYVLTGKWNGNNLEITSCEFQKKWILVPKTQRGFFDDDFAATCNSCGINYSPGQNTEINNMPGVLMCTTSNLSPAVSTCYNTYGICKLSSTGSTCLWENNKDLKKCLTKQHYTPPSGPL